MIAFITCKSSLVPLLYICGLGLCPFNELVCDLLPRQLSWFVKDALPEEYPSHNLDNHCLEDTTEIPLLAPR